ncbi:sugar transferase [Metabacillus halosaccharovorans]|uniref:Sugar transferase n=1 Tax=Metabacillus halosaccharovorans TaxID=930124 RepID=A0ABT3DBQ6_9BACI|nr:sugar transferase [Metabacillus halosaccharovorans]MCV9884494.1 sugar transferase [Metabacillus halosaccharovorans]
MPGLSSESRSPQKITQIELSDSNNYLIIKRVVDIVGSVIGLLLVSFLFVIIAIVIKVEDPKGPVFFRQTRVGKDGKEFNMYKFRSMVSNAEELLKDLLEYNEVSGAMFKMKEDPRVTKIGKFIRKTSIDELPQLWNVLKGDMSLVGPRPPLPREVDEYTDFDKQRLLVVPGCTGLWQVSGRSNIGFEEMVKLDIEYIENRTILVDFKIILKTVLMLFGSKDAY